MTRAIVIITLLLIQVIQVLGQVHVRKLVIKQGEVYILGQTDILVADTLVMKDSSEIFLNRLKAENYIHAKIAIFGNGCILNGCGVNGKVGRKGRDGDTPIGPCQDGTHAKPGMKGLDGTNGINLFLYFDQLTIKGKLSINLTGGKGGKGGNGGNGGGGGTGTVHCRGGNGGDGGNGGAGGKGGDGGTLTVSCKKCATTEALIGTKIVVANGGGVQGHGGEAGYEGPPGLAPSKKNGRSGNLGMDGENGKAGNPGTVKLETK